MSKTFIIDMCKKHEVKHIVLSLLTALIFYLLLAAVVIIPTVKIMYFYMPNMVYFMIGIYVYLAGLNIFFSYMFVKTLHSYDRFVTIDYTPIKTFISTVMTILVFIILAWIYLYIN